MSYVTKVWAIAASAALLASCWQKEVVAPSSVPANPIAVTQSVPVQTVPIEAESSVTGTGHVETVEKLPAANPVNENPKNTDVPLASSKFFTLKDGKITLKLFSPIEQRDEEYVLEQADPETFRILSEEQMSPVSKDKSHVFYAMKTVEWADAPTFEMMNAYYAKDAFRVYARNGEMADVFMAVPWADVSTFRMTGDIATGDLSAEDKNQRYWGYTIRN